MVIILTSLSCGTDEGVLLELGNWKELSDFEGVIRSGAVSFAIGDKGYVATGYDGFDRLNDLWEFDVEKNFWVQKADFPGAARNAAVAFSVGGKGYLGTGYNGSDELKDFWEYDPVSKQLGAKGGFWRFCPVWSGGVFH